MYACKSCKLAGSDSVDHNVTACSKQESHTVVAG